MAAQVLAWRPFLDPINFFHGPWFLLLIPMAIGVAVVYKAVRLDEQAMQHYWRHVAVMTTQIVLAMIGLGAASYAFVEWFVPVIRG